jgi:hypothetical protein
LDGSLNHACILKEPFSICKENARELGAENISCRETPPLTSLACLAAQRSSVLQRSGLPLLSTLSPLREAFFTSRPLRQPLTPLPIPLPKLRVISRKAAKAQSFSEFRNPNFQAQASMTYHSTKHSPKHPLFLCAFAPLREAFFTPGPRDNH